MSKPSRCQIVMIMMQTSARLGPQHKRMGSVRPNRSAIIEEDALVLQQPAQLLRPSAPNSALRIPLRLLKIQVQIAAAATEEVT